MEYKNDIRDGAEYSYKKSDYDCKEDYKKDCKDEYKENYKNDCKCEYKDEYKNDCKSERKDEYKGDRKDEYEYGHKDKEYREEDHREDKKEPHKGGCKCKENCDKECSIYTGISVPVELEPDADVGDVETFCSGDPVVTGECCEGDSLKFVITQQVIVKIPVCFKVKAKHGKCKADCKGHR